MVRLKSLGTVVALAQGTTAGLVPYVYDKIPLGRVTPNGWLRTEMETEASGLAGHLYDFYRFVHDSSWLDGKGDQEYSGLNEAFPYWLNALVPLAYTLNDQRLKDQVHEATQYVLDNKVTLDGWIGPEEGKYRLIWARTLLFMGFTNLVDANRTWEEPIVNAMHNFYPLMHSMLKNNGTGIVEQEDSVLDAGYYFWFAARTEDMMLSLQWLYDNYPRGQEEMLLDNMKMLHHYGNKWEWWFQEENFIKQDLYDMPESDTDNLYQFLHGVNVGEGLKAPAVIRRFTHDDSLIQTAKDGVDWTMKYHGAASGTVLADERMDGVNPYYGSETCTNVEVIFSMLYNYMALGESFYADGSELAAYNALPGAMTGDWWGHVYMSQPNMPYSKNLSETPFYNTNSYGQVYGLEPNYPCCTVNHPQGLPKFTQAAYMMVGNNGILHALLSPTTVETNVNGGAVKIECVTNYPFEDDLNYEIQADKPFDFYVRIPTWATGSQISSNTATALYHAADGMHKISLPKGKSSLTYSIGTDVRTEPRANDTVAVYRGQLLYAAEIGAEMSIHPPTNYENYTTYPPSYAPSHSHDWKMLNTTEWNIAIDPSTLEYHPAEGSEQGSVMPLPKPIFASGNPPMYMIAQACLIDWPLFKGSVPGNPIPKEDRKCLSDTFSARLMPYGSAKLRMAELPTINLQER